MSSKKPVPQKPSQSPSPVKKAIVEKASPSITHHFSKGASRSTDDTNTGGPKKRG